MHQRLANEVAFYSNIAPKMFLLQCILMGAIPFTSQSDNGNQNEMNLCALCDKILHCIKSIGNTTSLTRPLEYNETDLVFSRIQFACTIFITQQGVRTRKT